MNSTEDRPLLRAWRALFVADLLYKAIAFALLTPLTGVLLRRLIGRTGTSAVTDLDIGLFFFTTWSGASALLLAGALILGVTALEQACLMTVALGALRGTRPRVRDAFAHAASRAFAILRLAALLVVRVFAIVAPFAAAIGATYWVLLTGHDINYYLAERPPAFWGAAAIAFAILAVLALVLVRRLVSWLLVLPLVVFERVLPVRAFAESVRRMQGRGRPAARALAIWAALAIVLPIISTWGVHMIGRAIAPAFGGTLPRFLLFVGGLALAWGAAALTVAITSAALFAWIVVRAYAIDGGPIDAPRPEPFEERGWRISWPGLVGLLAGAVLLAAGAAGLVMRSAWTDRPVVILAHRGASAGAPENTLAAFRLAGELRTDFVELDVQETLDGEVVVVHDSDLMKVGGSPLKIWEATFDQLRAVDVGSRFDPRFRDARVPTLAEALASSRGVSRVVIELKSYGHDQRLEERVVEIVTAAGMQDDVVTMSLDREMVAGMKRLRPEWASGLLAAKAIGDLGRVAADFLAVEKSMVTRRFVTAAHRAGKPVYAWTVDDPTRMIRMLGLGVDGLITNRPDVAREVLDRYSRMSQAERLFLVVMTRLGAEGDTPPAERELRP